MASLPVRAFEDSVAVPGGGQVRRWEERETALGVLGAMQGTGLGGAREDRKSSRVLWESGAQTIPP